MNRFITVIICLNCYQVFSQPLHPSIDFGGTNVDWKYILKDTFNKPLYISGVITEEDQGTLDSPPIEIENKIFLNYNNYYSRAFGNVLNCFELKSGELKWVKYYNPATENGYGLNYYNHLNYLGNNYLELNGISSAENNLPAPSGLYFYQGTFAKRIVDIETGEDIYKYNKKGYYFYSSIYSDKYHLNKTNKQETFYIVQLWRGNGYSLIPMYLDIENDTIIDSRIVDTLDLVTFQPYNSNGSSNNLSVKGPFINADTSLYTYYTEHLMNTTWKHFFWQTDVVGNVKYKKDVSDALNGIKHDTYAVEINQSKDKIIAILRTPDATSQDHRGYAIIDLEGNVIKNKSQLIIEGKKVGHLSSIFLNNSEDMLHVIRFQNSNNLFFYVEDKAGNFRKAGELINPNDEDLAFVPRHILHTSDNGIVLTGEFLVVSKKFGEGGWQVILKISGESLGLSTSTKEISELPSFIISPNPSSSIITIKSDLLYDEVLLYDMFGKTVLKDKINKNQIDISSLPNATYLCELRQSGQVVSKGVKFVKVE